MPINAEEKFRTRGREAGAKIRQVIDAASGEVSEVTEVLEERIQRKPVQSTLIALAGGVLLGLLLRRR